MKPLARVLRVVVLVSVVFAGIDWFLMDRQVIERVAGLVSPAAAPPAPATSTTREKALASAAVLEDVYKLPEYEFASRRLALRDIVVSGSDLTVMADITADTPRLRVWNYSALMQHCPIAGREDYWHHEFAQPFTIYVAMQGRDGARALARCTSAHDWDRFVQIQDRSASSPHIEQRPREGEDYESLEAATTSGSPSFADVRQLIRSNEYVKLQHALNRRPELVDQYDGSGRTLLFSATSPEAVMILAGYGANPNAQDANGTTPLQLASELGESVDTLNALIRNDASAELTFPEYALTGELAGLLLEQGAPISENALYEALDSRRFDVAEALFRNGADINTTTLAAPLHYFAREIRDSSPDKLDQEIEAFRRAHRYGIDLQLRESGLTIREYLAANPGWQGHERLIAILDARSASNH